MTSTTRSALLRQLAQDLFPERYIEFTALADSTTTLLQANELRHADASANALDPGWVYLYAGTSAGDERNITEYDPRAAATYGTVTPHRPFTSDLDATSVGFVYTGGLPPSQLLAHLNASLRRSRRQRPLAYTLVSDGLMESSATTTWDAAGSATLSKVTPTLGEGSRSLAVTSGSGGDYTENTTVPGVAAGERYCIEAKVHVTNTSGTHAASLVVYDATNAAAILTLSTSNRTPTRLYGEFTVPSGCYAITIRLSGSGTGTVGQWDEVLLWSAERSVLRLPSDINKFDEVRDVFQRVRRGSGTAGSDASWADDYDLVRLSGWEQRVDDTAGSPFLLDLSRSGWSKTYPVVVEALLPHAELTADSDTTTADRDDLVLRAKGLSYAQLARVGPGENRRFYQAQADLLGRTWATAASRQPRPAYPVKAPRSSGGGNSTRRWWRG